MPTLPSDIHSLTLEWVYRSSQSGIIDYGTLYSCSLVCRSWVTPAQRLLFRRLPTSRMTSLHENPASLSVQRLINTLSANSVLGTYVRALAFDASATERSVNALIALLALTPNIAKLTVVGDLRTPEQCYHALLRTLPLTVIDITDVSSVCAFLALFPHLRHLCIASCDGAPTAAPFPGYLDSINAAPSIDWEVFGWLLPDGRGVAEVEDYFCGMSDLQEQQLDIFVANAHEMRSLTVAELPAAHIVAMLTGLEELIILMLPCEPIPLPRTVHHVAYFCTDGCEEDVYQLVCNFLPTLRDLPNLRLVSATRHSSVEVLDLLRQTCRELEVEFLVHASVDSLQRRRHVDWL